MCGGLMGCIIVIAESINLVFGLALAAGCGVFLWCPPIKQKLLQFLIDQLQSATDGQFNQNDINETAEKLWEMLTPVALGLFCFGLFIVLVAIIAFIGVCCRVTCMLFVFAIITGLIVIALLVVIIIYFTNKSILLEPVHKTIEKIQKRYKSMSSGELDSKIAAVVMQAGKCCGYLNGSDFYTKGYCFTRRDSYNGQEIAVQYPIPCCKPEQQQSSQCPVKFTPVNSNINHGCRDSLDKFITPMMNSFMYGLIGVLIGHAILFGAVVGVIAHRRGEKDR